MSDTYQNNDNDTDFSDNEEFYDCENDKGIECCGKLINSNEEMDLYIITNYDIFISNVKIWEQNRIPDKKRVEEITKGYIEGNIVPCVFHVSEIKIKNNTEYKLWDGQHRYKALRDLYLKLPDLNFIKSIFFVMIYKNDTEKGIEEKFTNINMAVPVPIKEFKNLKLIDSIHYIVRKICKKYNNCQSPKYNCVRPNFNQDKLQEQIVEFFKDRKIDSVDKNQLWNKIKILNQKYLENISDLNIKSYNILQKVSDRKCALFATKKFFMEDLF